MLETGEYVDIRFQNEVRYKKPVGIYWLQAGVVKAAEAVGIRGAQTKIWLYRIPSLAGAIGAVLLTYWAALAFVSRRAALLAGLMMASSILLGVEARLAKTDAMLLLTCVATMGAMARAYLVERRPASSGPGAWTLPAIFWTALAAGILLKGPLILLFVVLAIVPLAIIDRSVRWLGALKPVPGLIWLCVLVLPWFLAIMGRAGNTFLAESVGRDLLGKIISVQEAHGAPPGYYFVLFWLTFWPGATLAAMAVPGVWAARREKGAKFLLAWIVPAWILLELVITKLPHYVLPLYPAIAILIAGVVDTSVLARQRWLTRGAGSWFFMPMVARHRHGHRAGGVRAAARIVRLAVHRRLDDLRPLGLAAVRRRRRGAFAAARDRGLDPAHVRHLCLHHPGRSPPRSRARRCRASCARPTARTRRSRRPAITSRAWCSSPAPRRGSPTAPTPPSSCAPAIAGSR